MSRARLVPLLAALAGCTDPTATTTDAGPSTTGDASTPGTTGTTGTTGAPEPTSEPTGPGSTGSTGEPGFDPPAPVCGNGYLEGDEECDDGNRVDDDACTSACTVPCGLAAQVLALAPSAQSELWAVAVAPAPDGGVVVVARQREITADMEGMQTIGLVRTRVLRYGADLGVAWDRLLDPADASLAPGGVVVDAAGDAYIAATVDGPDLEDILVVKLAADDGAPVWTVTHDGAATMSEDLAQGLALAPDGDVVVAGRARELDGDDDVWVRKLAASDGGALWTSTWSGVGNGEFSVDGGGRLAVAPDGAVYVGAREYVDFNTTEGVLLRFPAGGGKAEWVFSPLADGTDHIHVAGWVSADKDGNALVSIHRTSGAAPTFWLYKVDPAGEVLWQRDLAYFQDAGDRWSLDGAAFDAAGNVFVTGNLRVKDKTAQLTYFQSWTARLDPAGERRCQIYYTAESMDLVPPSLYAFDAALAGDGTGIVGGQQLQNEEQQLWVGLFRP